MDLKRVMELMEVILRKAMALHRIIKESPVDKEKIQYTTICKKILAPSDRCLHNQLKFHNSIELLL